MSLCSTALGCLVLLNVPQENATIALIGPTLIGAGLAAVFPVVLGYVGDRYPQQSGTAFGTIFVIALTGNMLINKTFGHIAHDYGVQQYPKVLLAALAVAAVLLHFLNNLTTTDNTGSQFMNSLATQWLNNARAVMDHIEQTQMENIRRAAEVMADSIEAGRWVHVFGCGHATIPVEEMYPRIGGFVGFHPMVELPMTFFTRIVGEMGVHQFLFLERAEGYGVAIMKAHEFDPRDTMWIFSHSGINNVNIDVALEAKKRGMKVIAYGSAAAARRQNDAAFVRQNDFSISPISSSTRAHRPAIRRCH